MVLFQASDGLLLVWVAVLLVELVAQLASKHLGKPSAQEQATFQMTRAVKIEMRQHRGPESFVKRAKLERQLIALEKDAAAMKEARLSAKGSRDTLLGRGKWGCLLLVAAYHWSEPLFTVGAWGLWPLGWLFALPGHPPGSIGSVLGVVVAQQGAARILSICI